LQGSKRHYMMRLKRQWLMNLTKLTKRCSASTRRHMMLAIFFPIVMSLSNEALAASASNWLAFDVTLLGDEETIRDRREISLDAFRDEVSSSVSITQNIRNMMEPGSLKSVNEAVDAMQTGQEMGAESWLLAMPKAKQQITEASHPRFDCRYDVKDSRVSCGQFSSINVDGGDAAPKVEVYGRDLVARISREGSQTGIDNAAGSKNQSAGVNVDKPNMPENTDAVRLVPRRDGLVTVAGGSIRFAKVDVSKKVLIDDALSGVELSIFVRDPSVITWNENNGTLTAHKAGKTEVFVVTPNRISIIETHIDSDSNAKTSVALASAMNAKQQNPGGLELPTTLASLDGLDIAASKKYLRASNGPLSSDAQDLSVADDVAKLGRSALSAGSQFVRSKARASFESIRIKVVDDRSVPGGPQYPASGVRVKIAGTEFSELTNHQGEIEVRDVPVGSRLLLDIADERGVIMPQVTEISSDRDGVSRSLAQTVQVRRFVSLDLAARSGGVVQDMGKSSFCGAVTRGGNPGSGVRVSLDAKAMGPFYFNHLGFVDLRLGATSNSGKFCFFNVEPGPVAVAFAAPEREEALAGVIGLVAGRHSEESFDLSTAKYLSTTLTSIASASEQLGSDEARAVRHDLVEQADIYAIGSGQMMVPIDEGLMTTPAAVLPTKGRVWTVSASSDFETSIQGVSISAPSAKQISTLVPNGFLSDMAVFAQQTHNSDQGSVVVEHGHLSGAATDGTKMRLVDAFGRDAGDGWYFADHPVSKAIFFNVPPGIYSLVVETATGHWIAADTVIVYSESVTVAKTGGQLEKI
jgi:hypothetical protein